MDDREPFDRDGFTFTPSRDGEGWRVRCDSCAACIINGVPCHETGCANARRRGPSSFDEFDGEEGA